MVLIFFLASICSQTSVSPDFSTFCVNFISAISQPKAPKKVEICITETKTLCHSSTEQPKPFLPQILACLWERVL